MSDTPRVRLVPLEHHVAHASPDEDVLTDDLAAFERYFRTFQLHPNKKGGF